MGFNGTIIIVCVLLLVAYMFDISTKKTRIPSVILLLLTGFLTKGLLNHLGISTPDISPLLPVFGTLGLILIVLEGSLELHIDRGKLPLIKKSVLAAVLLMFGISITLALAISIYSQIPFRQALLNAIPVAIISSAIAIPASRDLPRSQREFVVYESSLSDILGVLFFNFIHQNNHVRITSFGIFALELLLMSVITIAASLLLALMIKNIRHHVKYAPVIITLILVYMLAKTLHLPALLFVLFTGLFLANMDRLKKWSLPFFKRLDPGGFNHEIEKFSGMVAEGTFLIRALFFLIFGFLITPEEVTNQDSMLFAGLTFLLLISYRFIILYLLKQPLHPLLFLAPRGLITVLLYISIEPELHASVINKSYITQVILMTAVFLIPAGWGRSMIRS